MTTLVALALSSSAALLVPSDPVPPRALLSNVPGAPTSLVPGLGGVSFQPGASVTHFDRVYAHPSGHWAITAFADLPSSRDECLIVDGALVLQEGSPAPWTAGADCGTIDQRVGVNSSGDFVLATNVSGTVDDDYVAGRIGGTWTTFAQEGGAVPGLAGATLDDTIDSPLLLDDGRAGYAADGIDGLGSTSIDDVLVLGGALLLQEGVTAPAGQAGGASRAIENFDLGDFWASGDGTSWLVQGDLEGSSSSDDVVVVDGAIVLQEGEPVAGSGFVDPIASSGIHGVSMTPDGTWFARGENAGGGADWVVRSGALVASTGAPVFAGSAEVWDDADVEDTFTGAAGNGLGDYVVAGATLRADGSASAVVAINGAGVVARTGDPVDVDGNGLLDDGLFLHAFGTGDLALTDDLRVLAVVTLGDASGSPVAQALVELDARGPVWTRFCEAGANSTGATGSLNARGTAGADANDLVLCAGALPPSAFAIAIASHGTADQLGAFGGDGRLCLASPFAPFRSLGDIGVVAADGSVEFALDLTSVPWPGGAASVAPGETLYFQVLHRDWLPGPTSNLTEALGVTFR
ncbi:MAG: hypothetical protein AAFR54_22895 [Planctomycetota bacterium]